MLRCHALPRAVPAAVCVLLAACSDAIGTASDAEPPSREPLFVVACTADVASARVSCGGPLGDASNLVVGGQNVYVTMAAANVAFAADTFAFDATITNLIPQPLGTTNGSNADPAGVRVFFMGAPVGVGGSVTVANEDGEDTFTGTLQPYFQYAGMLRRDSTSLPSRWKLHLTPGTTSFDFVVAVSAAVMYESGYILGNHYVLTLNPSESRTLIGTVYSAVGNALPGETITWASSDPSVVSVSGDQAAGGASRGFAEVTGNSGPRPNDYTTAVSVCESVAVTSGFSAPASISAADCFSAFGSNSFRPSTSYYGDLYRVALTAGQTVTITLDSGDELDTYLVLADPLGFPVAVNDDDDEDILGVGSRVVYNATTTGVHVFEATTFNGLDTGNYTVVVTIS